MNSLLQDARLAIRGLLKRPGYTAVAVLALGLGIGLNTASYSTADALLFRPLLLDDLERLVQVGYEPPGRPGLSHSISPGDYYEWVEKARSFELLSTFDNWDANLTGQGEPERIRAYRVSWEFFRTLGAAPSLGRAFLEEEDVPGSERVVVLSHELWERRYGADPGLVGSEIELDSRRYEVIGIAPEQVRYPNTAELWAPLALPLEERENHDDFYLRAVGRLAPGMSAEQAQAEMEVLLEGIKKDYPETHENIVAAVYPLRISVSGLLTAKYTRLMLYSVGFVLLIACLNVAGLQFARITSRTKEMTIRVALGANRWKLVRIVLVENLLLALAGVGFGLIFAHWGVWLIKSGMPPEVEQFLPGWQRMSINENVLLFTIAAGVAAGLAAGLIPALLTMRVNLQDGLKDGSRTSTSGTGHQRIRSVLVVSEVVLAMVLLFGASLMVQSLQTITVVSPNMDAEKLLTFRVALPSFRYEDATDRREFSRELLDKLEGISGVRSVGMVSALPYSGSNWMSAYTLEERMGQGSKASVTMQNQVASEDYLLTMQIPLLEGQFIREEDTEDQPEVGVVNESFARAFFSDGRAIGKRIKLGHEDSTNPWITIVGVAGDVMMSPTDQGPRPTLYRSFRQDSLSWGDYVLRVDGDPLAAAGLVREAVREIDPLQPIYNLRTVEKLISDQLTGFTYIASFMGVFGVLAVVLAMMGVYSIMAHSVAERIGEIGIRMALGAESREVLWMILRRGLALTSIGLVVGVALSIPLGQLISGLIWGVSPNDPATFAGTILLFLGTAMAACLIPALRAARTDPVRVLRYE